MSLTRSKERVSDLGEVFTPDHIVQEMHDLIPFKKWADKTMIYLEPTCGNGQFVTDAVKRKIKAGLSAYDALNTTFGLDIMQDNIDETRLRVLEIVLKKINIKNRKREAKRLATVIVHNIFRVEDSIAFMSSGGMFDKPTSWESYPFLEKDPTGNKMVLGKKERRGRDKEAAELLKRVGY